MRTNQSEARRKGEIASFCFTNFAMTDGKQTLEQVRGIHKLKKNDSSFSSTSSVFPMIFLHLGKDSKKNLP
jgi:hypothetical protein